ncbi:MAG: prenyltransferase [Candidatus Dormibacteraeota bacterium]|nr:prenyltransferase [Candidatus Dormibacteraeota bacterium]
MTASATAGRGRISVLWASVRPRSLTVAAVSSVLGTAALVPGHAVQPLIALGCLVLAALLQAATNVLNDAEDALTGADDYAGAGASLAMRRQWINPAQARVIAAALFGASAVLGVTIALTVHRPALLLLGLLALLVGWAYTAPPLRLAYHPLGEAASGLPMGLGIVWGTAAAQTASVPYSVWWAAAPLALLTAGILHANNARDRSHDAAVGKRTLATRVSVDAVVLEFRLLVVLPAVLLVVALATHGLPLWCLGAAVPALVGLRLAGRARNDLDAMGWTRLLIGCVQVHMLTGTTLAAGFVLSAIRW